MNFTIRVAEVADVAAIASLSGELGYPASEAQIASRLAPLAASDADAVFVAVANEVVVGWIHVGAIRSLESEEFAEIRGLVVASSERGRGAGSRLVAAAEAWARERSFAKLRVRSNAVRTETRVFYERRGFRVTKTQNVFDKPLAP